MSENKMISTAMLTYRSVVYPWHCDAMGHMNTQFYAAAFDAAQIFLFNALDRAAGITDGDLGWADVAQNISYRQEVSPPQGLSVYSTISSLGNKSFTVLHSMTDQLAAVVATSKTTTVRFENKFF